MTTEERILDSAISLFSQKGYKNTSIKEIAGAANVNSLTVFRYFHDKDTLFLQAAEQMKQSSFDEASLERSLTYQDLKADLLAMGRAYRNEIHAMLPLIRIYIGEGANFEELSEDRWFISPVLKAHFRAYLDRLDSACPLAKENAGLLSEMFIAYITRKVMSASKHQDIWGNSADAEADFCREFTPQINSLAVMITGKSTI